MRGSVVRGGLALLTLMCLAGPGLAAPGKGKAGPAAKSEAPPLTVDGINAAAYAAPETAPKPKRDKRPQALLMKVQVLLDRAGFSPGAIDGRDGDNMRGALSAFAVAQGLPASKTLTQPLFDKLQATSADPVAVSYTITEADAAGPFVEKMPAKMEEQAELETMGYTTVREMLAERFHMARDLLSALNPEATLERAGTVITVAGVPPMETGKPKAEARDDSRKSDTKKNESRKNDGKKNDGDKGDARAEATPDTASKTVEKDIARIEIDKETKQLRAFDKSGALKAFYPASIGSEEKPAPSGSAKVQGIALDPPYTYNPKYAFKGVKSKEKFTIKPGPNNPVGLVWIDLSIPSYGIHGTPEPEKVGKTESHGCIRLTNWDARDLAARVERGATVEFKDE